MRAWGQLDGRDQAPSLPADLEEQVLLPSKYRDNGACGRRFFALNKAWTLPSWRRPSTQSWLSPAKLSLGKPLRTVQLVSLASMCQGDEKRLELAF